MTFATSLAGVLVLVGAGCSGASHDTMDRQTSMMMESMAMPMDDGATFGPLEVGADYASYVKVNTAPVTSESHGGRLVDTYVNAVGAAAYLDDDGEIPVGTIVVKTSVDAKDGSAGPIFVMEKKVAGFDPDHGDWYYAIHWAAPPPKFASKLGGPIYWRSPSHKVGYCVECHDNYDRNLGNVPADHRIAGLPDAE
ncbi:MAG: hypothetical protein R3B06_14220 [Kofleriaceae bacterium]